MTQGIIKNKIYIPEEDTTEECLQDGYEIEMFNESVCARCPYRKDKPNEYCQACGAYEGILRLWSKVTVKGKNYYSIPAGNIKRAKEVTGIDFSLYKDLRCKTPFSNPLKWTGKLREGEIVNDVKSANQKEIVDKWLGKKRYGFIQAPPRTGKTVIANCISMSLGVKTLIIAHQNELLVNFMDSLKRDTNLLELREQTGKEIAKIMESKKDLEKEDYDILLFTYQSFIREANEEDIKKYLKGHYGLIIVDEAHQAGATAYAKFLGKLDARYRLGMSATPLRKDALNFVLLNLIGPTTVKSESTGLIPRIEIIETGIKSKYKYSLFVKAYQYLQRNEDRNKLLLKEVIKDLNDGHNCIIIPVDSKAHMNALVNSINAFYKDDIALGYWRGVENRKSILKEIDAGKYKVIVAIKSMIKQGIDLKVPTMLYLQIGMSAEPQPKGCPMFYQMSNRVCTPFSGKREPIVKIFVDDLPQSYGCFRSLFTKEIKPGLATPKDGKPKYKMSQKAFDYATSIIKRIGIKNYSQSGKYNPDRDLEKPKEKPKAKFDLFTGSWL